MNGKATVWIFWATVGLVGFLFLAAFALSYDALYHVASTSITTYLFGIETLPMALLWPLGLDAFMAAASLYLLWASLNRKDEALPLSLVILAMGASVVFNVVHAPRVRLAQAVAALPPLVAFLAFEVLIIMVRHETRKDTVSQAVDELEANHERLRVEMDEAVNELQTTRARTRAARERIKELTAHEAELRQVVSELEQVGGDPVAARRERLRVILSENGREWTQDELAAELGVSVSTLKRDLRAIEDA